MKNTFLLQKPNSEVPQIPTAIAYDGKIPINHKKMQYLAKIVLYIPNEYKPFYEEVLTRSTTATMEDDGQSEGEQQFSVCVWALYCIVQDTSMLQSQTNIYYLTFL